MVPVDRRGFEPQVPPVHGHVPEHGGPAEGDDGQDDSAPPPGEANGKEEIGGGGEGSEKVPRKTVFRIHIHRIRIRPKSGSKLFLNTAWNLYEINL